MASSTLPRPARLADIRRGGLRTVCGVIGAGALILAVVLGFFNPADFFRAYLFAALACLNPALGCLLLTFIHRMTGGTWGRTLAPALDAGCRMAPWALLFCLPILLGLWHLFPWAAPDALDEHARALLAKHPAYFSHGAFVLRAVAYVVMSLPLLWMARRGDAAAWTGPVGMMTYVAVVYLLAVDWVMSLEPGWSSTGFPVIFMASQALSALAFCIAATVFMGSAGSGPAEPAGEWSKIGSLLLGTLMFWAYVAYAQFLVVWSGNLPGQAAWYVHRGAGGWRGLLIALAVAQLLIPALLLLSNRIKRRTPFFGGLAFGVLLCQNVYLYWLVLPSFRPQGIGFHPLDALLPLALDGLWLFAFLGFQPVAIPEEDAAHA